MKERASKTAWGVLGLLGQLCGGPLSGDLARSFENDVDLAPSQPHSSDLDPNAKAEEIHRRLITKSSETPPRGNSTNSGVSSVYFRIWKCASDYLGLLDLKLSFAFLPFLFP